MTVARAPAPEAARQAAADIVMDGLFTGMIGAVVVAAWFMVLDLLRGQPLMTPALLGAVLLHGAAAAATTVRVGAPEVAAYTAFHFVAFMAVGLLLSWLMSLFERFPIVFFVLALLFVFLQVGFIGLSVALHLEAPGLLPAWGVMVANLLASAAMAAFLAARHRGALRRVESLWVHGD